MPQVIIADNGSDDGAPERAEQEYDTAVIASGGLQVVKIAGGEGTGETGWGPIIIATVIAFAVGYAVIAWFMKFIETHTFTPFMIYRILLALGLFALLGTGTISA